MSDRIVGALLMLLGGAYVALAFAFEAAFFTDPLGPRFVPVAIGLFMIGSAAALLVRPTRGVRWPGRRVWRKLVAALLVFVGYAYLLEPVGFIVATTVAFALFSRLFAAPYWRAFLAGAVFAGVLFALFVGALDLYLPAGAWFEALI